MVHVLMIVFACAFRFRLRTTKLKSLLDGKRCKLKVKEMFLICLLFFLLTHTTKGYYNNYILFTHLNKNAVKMFSCKNKILIDSSRLQKSIVVRI